MTLALGLVTAPSMEVAASLGRTLVEEHLVACANLVPGLRSIYRWDGAVQDEAEVLMILKFLPERFEAVRARVVALHPYQVPEVVMIAAADVHPPYLDWVSGATVR